MKTPPPPSWRCGFILTATSISMHDTPLYLSFLSPPSSSNKFPRVSLPMSTATYSTARQSQISKAPASSSIPPSVVSAPQIEGQSSFRLSTTLSGRIRLAALLCHTEKTLKFRTSLDISHSVSEHNGRNGMECQRTVLSAVSLHPMSTQTATPAPSPETSSHASRLSYPSPPKQTNSTSTRDS